MDFFRNAKGKNGRSTVCKVCWILYPHKKFDYSTEKERERRAKSPQKVRARRAVQQAVLRGKLIKKPCEVCGITNVQAHHKNYSKQLDVKWLCRKHHELEHNPI